MVPVLLLILLGILELGRAIYLYNTISSAAREGARFGMVLAGEDAWETPGNSPRTYTTTTAYVGTNTIVGKVLAQGTLLEPSKTTVIIATPQGRARNLQLPLEVTVSYPYTPVVGYVVPWLPTIQLVAKTTMRLE